MADLTLALATPVAVAAASTTVTATPGKAAAATRATDPFAILMAAATPAAAKVATVAAPAAPVTTVPVAANADDAVLPDVAEKTSDDSGSKDDADGSASPDALLALLTTSAPAVQPLILAPVAAAPAPVVNTPDAAPAAKPAIAFTPTVTIAAQAVATADQPAAAPVPVAAPVFVAAPVAAAQTSIHALVQMMAAQAKAAPVQQQAAAQATPEATPAITSDDPAATAPVEAEQATPVTAAKPATRAIRMIAPKLDASTTPFAKAVAKVQAPAAKAETAPAKAQDRTSRATADRTADDAAPKRTADPATPQPQAATSHAASANAPAAKATAAADIGSTDAVVTRHLAVAKDGQWLDSLAKDIAATGGSNSNLSFTLSPENLGTLKVDVLAGSDGASVHMTTDNDTARNIILDAQPRLAAEARAQGLTIKETSVSTNSDSQRQPQSQAQTFSQSSGQQPGGQDRRAYAPAPQQPVSPSLSTPADEESDGALYA